MPQLGANPAGKEAWSDSAASPRLILSFGGGLNENVSPTLDECTYGYNFDLKANRPSLVQRQPFNTMGTAPNAGGVSAILQLIKRDATVTMLVCAGTVVYEWDGASTFTVKGSVSAIALLRAAYWSLGDYLVIADRNKLNPVKTWDGTTFANMVTGLGNALYAAYVFVFNSRVWLFNITVGSTKYPHMILVSKFEDPTVWDPTARGGASTVGGGTFSTGLEAFYLLTPDEHPINGVEVFQNVLIISTLAGSVWQLSGTSAKDYQFTQFHADFPPITGEGMKAVGNDVVTMSSGGHITMLYAVQAFGDALSTDLAYWLPVTLPQVTTLNCIVHDIERERVLFFVDDRVLVLFKELLAQDRAQTAGKPSPWSVYLSDYPSGFSTLHADYLLIPNTTTYTVMWGGPDGDVYNLNGAGNQDASSVDIRCARRSRHIGTEIQGMNPWPWIDENITGHVRYRRLNVASFSVEFEWDDEMSTTQTDLILKGPSPADSPVYFGGAFYFGGPIYFGQGFAGIARVASQNIEPGGKGPGFYLTVSSNAGKQIQVDAIELD